VTGTSSRRFLRAETGGANQWVLKWRELPGFARVNKVTSTSLGNPISVFNKSSTLKQTTLYDVVGVLVVWRYNENKNKNCHCVLPCLASEETHAP